MRHGQGIEVKKAKRREKDDDTQNLISRGEYFSITDLAVQQAMGRKYDSSKEVWFQIKLFVNKGVVIALRPFQEPIEGLLKGWKTNPKSKRLYVSARSTVSAMKLELNTSIEDKMTYSVEDGWIKAVYKKER